MMDQNRMHAVFRELTGNPPESVVSWRQIDTHLRNGVSFVAEELRVPREMVTEFTLEAGVYRYPLPSDFLQVQDVQWNNLPIKYSSIQEWRRYSVNWLGSTPGNPQEIAIDGRDLLVYPAPSASAVSTDSTLFLRVQVATFNITESGVPGFSDTDVLLAVYAGAQEFMSFKNMDGRYDRLLAGIDRFLAPRLVAAKQRYQQMLQDNNQGIGVFSGRIGPAR